jgi:Mn2+/Fe2+ NRAMP family transporter
LKVLVSLVLSINGRRISLVDTLLWRLLITLVLGFILIVFSNNGRRISLLDTLLWILLITLVIMFILIVFFKEIHGFMEFGGIIFLKSSRSKL